MVCLSLMQVSGAASVSQGWMGHSSCQKTGDTSTFKREHRGLLTLQVVLLVVAVAAVPVAVAVAAAVVVGLVLVLVVAADVVVLAVVAVIDAVVVTVHLPSF